MGMMPPSKFLTYLTPYLIFLLAKWERCLQVWEEEWASHPGCLVCPVDLQVSDHLVLRWVFLLGCLHHRLGKPQVSTFASDT
jgi:hypothetical protein